MPRVSIPGIQCQYETYKAIQAKWSNGSQCKKFTSLIVSSITVNLSIYLYLCNNKGTQ